MKLKSLQILLILSVLSWHNLYADALGADVKILSSMLVNMKKELKTVIDALEEAKKANDFALDLKKLMGDIQSEYEFVNNFNLENEINDVVDDFKDLTYIDEFRNASSAEEKYNYLRSEIDKGFKNKGINKKEKELIKKKLDSSEAIEKIRNAYFNEAISPSAKTTKDNQVRETSAILFMGSEAAEAKIKRLELEIKAREKLLNEVVADKRFVEYLSSESSKNKTDIDTGAFANLVGWVFNPQDIYTAVGKMAAVSTLVLWLLVIAYSIRILQEAMAGLSLRGSMGVAISEMSLTITIYTAYTSLGTLLFGLIFIFNELFEGFGSTSLIHNELFSLRGSLLTNDAQYKSLLDRIVRIVADAGNSISLPLIWAAYHLFNLIYIFITELIDFIFALFVGLVYIIGFVAIATSALKEPLNLIKGWISSIMFLFLWAIIEPILLAFVYFITVSSNVEIIRNYSTGIGSTSLWVWYLYTMLVLFTTLLVKIISPFIAAKLASNLNVGSVAGSAIAAPALVMMNQFLASLAKQATGGGAPGGGSGVLSRMMPSSDGTRTRDTASQKVSDVMNADVRDAGKMVKNGLGNIANKFNKGS